MVLVRDRLIGGLVGLVVGDALGVPVEFTPRRERDADPVRGLRGYGTHLQPPGTWSDDGALALAHAGAFLAHGWDPAAHLRAFLAWLDAGEWTPHGRAFDVGTATRAALERFRAGAPLAAVGGRGERDNGNGALMRILPAACWWAGGADAAALAGRLGEASALTHAHPRSRLCCALHGLLAERLLAGEADIARALAEAGRRLAPLVPAAELPHLAPLLDAACLAWPRERVPSDGYVVSTLIAACWSLHRHPDFAGAVLAAVNLGDDTDSTGAVTGGLAGLRAGLAGIPRPWTTCLPRGAWLFALAERFADACLAPGPAAAEGTRPAG